MELVFNVKLELIHLEEQKHVNHVIKELIQQQDQVVVHLVQMENLHLKKEVLLVQHVQQIVMVIVTKQLVYVYHVKLDMDF